MGTSASSTKFPPLETVKYIDLPRFMGTWYVIGVKPTYFEQGAKNSTETYTWNEKAERVDIDFTFTSTNGRLQKIPQKGYIFDKNTNSEWRVSPAWPLKLPYLVIEIGEDQVTQLWPNPYSYTVIGYPSREYVWIMSRKKEMDEDLYNSILERLSSVHHYDLNGLVKVEHTT